MTNSERYKANNEGGYCNPPVAHQFKGNPGPGRPKGSTSLEGSLRKVFGKKVVKVDKSGKRTTIYASEALAERALELGMRGPLQANIEARKLAERYGSASDDDSNEVDITRLSDADLELYGYLAHKLRGMNFDKDIDERTRTLLMRIAELVAEEG